MTGEVIDVAGIPLHIVVDGAGDPPVLLLAGVAGQVADWDPAVGLLAGRHRVVRYDRPGLGGSPPRPAYPTLAEEVDRIGAVAARYGLRRPIVVAHSAAAFHAEAYARLRPGAVGGLVLVDPSWEERPRPRGRLGARFARWSGRGVSLLARGADAVRIPRLLGPPIWRLMARTMTHHSTPPDGAAQVYRDGRVAAAAYIEWLAYRDWFADLARLRRRTPGPAVPTVVLTALGDLRRDRARRRWRSAHGRLAATFPHGRQVVVTDAGHLVGLDRPDAVAAAVAEVAG